MAMIGMNDEDMGDGPDTMKKWHDLVGAAVSAMGGVDPADCTVAGDNMEIGQLIKTPVGMSWEEITLEVLAGAIEVRKAGGRLAPTFLPAGVETAVCASDGITGLGLGLISDRNHIRLMSWSSNKNEVAGATAAQKRSIDIPRAIPMPMGVDMASGPDRAAVSPSLAMAPVTAQEMVNVVSRAARALNAPDGIDPATALLEPKGSLVNVEEVLFTDGDVLARITTLKHDNGEVTITREVSAEWLAYFTAHGGL